MRRLDEFNAVFVSLKVIPAKAGIHRQHEAWALICAHCCPGKSHHDLPRCLILPSSRRKPDVARSAENVRRTAPKG
jgi:hypothetical protein